MAIRLCECGCGQTLPPIKRWRLNARFNGIDTRRFILGHNFNGSNNHKWVGGRRTDKRPQFHGRVSILCKNHPRADFHGYVFEHILVAEKALGKYLPVKSVIHHINGNAGDNRSSNLIICQDQAYHNYIHQRMRAYKATGDVNKRKCSLCKKYDEQSKLRKGQTNYVHPQCARNYVNTKNKNGGA